MTGIRLVAPGASAAEPSLDADQARAVSLAASGTRHVVVTGAPGTGKTTAVVAAAVAAVDAGVAPQRLLVIAPTRLAAAELRDRVGVALDRPTGAPVVRTAASAAHAVLAAQAASLGLPAPGLITGAEQDVILREMLAGHARGDGRPVSWEGVVPADATALPGFRAELRDLLMRAAEAGVTADELREIGERAGRPEWVAAAEVMGEYEDITILGSLHADRGERYDPATVAAQAASVLEGWEERAEGPAPAWDLVIVDDHQDSTRASTALLGAMAARGARLMLVGNADQAVQGYRGAVPGALADAAAGALGPADHVELVTAHRQESGLARVTAAVAERIGVKGVGSARGAHRTVARDVAAPVTVLTAPHSFAQSRAIAAQLRRSRHDDGVSWGDMVVIARSAGRLRQIRSDLLASDVPCEAVGDGAALHLEPAVAPLLDIVRVALAGAWDEESALAVLGSRLIGLDAVALRRLRRALVREERAGGGVRSSTDLLVDAMADPARWGALEVPEARSAARASRAADAARARIAEPAATPGAVLWAAWEALGVAEAWRRAAVAGSARDDADLDAVIALMRAAQTFAERMPRSGVGLFIEHLEGQEFAADTLGARGQSRDVVSFCTPAAAAGRAWDVVVAAGLEEGVWPNLRLRDSVLGAQSFADLVQDGALVAGSDARGPRDLHGARRAVLDDETRALLVAVSRARRRLVVTAVDDGESRPSRYVALIEDVAGAERQEAAGARVVADLRAAVAALRIDGAAAVRRLDSHPDDRPAREALDGVAAQLARLADAQVPGADPAEWHGVPGLSTVEGYWDEDDEVRVSPSRLDAVRGCALKWALETAGGTVASTDAQQVGSLVHEIAAQFPSGGLEPMLAELERRWPEIGGDETWLERLQRDDARGMIARLARYLDGVEADRVLVEQGFGVVFGSARVSGMADRVEIDGTVARIVDLKTGRKISAAEAADHGQLKLYQLVANSGAFEGVDAATDAALVFVGTDAAQKSSVVPQDAIDVAEVRAELDEAVSTMRAQTFLATPNPMCTHCPIRRSCPAHAAGAQVSDA
ncbi:UrvD/REP family ATP-dependent DNA helicase [uncultured Demequina sp.]|uniref:UrvD/REP family ATP-dependent DNA helicase n=1 Tax=uncultured Demequina sp. TaxID=693499 RepID=UPI0025EA0061|nr:UrvD/REP family ATP-dependent DNA helicase [uncultured Demequina sp.]